MLPALCLCYRVSADANWEGYPDLRMLHPSSAVELFAKLPNANTLDWKMVWAGDWGRYFVLDDMYRKALITAAQTGPAASLPAKNIRLHLKSPGARESDKLPNLISPLSYDPLACAVRRLTRNCTVQVSTPHQFT